MEEIDISLDEQQETIHHHAAHSPESWLLYCALISAFLAVAAAISGLYSSHYANEAMFEQMQASDLWGYYQAKGVKSMVTELRGDMLTSSGLPVPETLGKKIAEYHQEQQETKEKADEKTKAATLYMQRHEKLSMAVTAFQIAIAITAMSAISRRKHFMLLTAALALAGTGFSIAAALV